MSVAAARDPAATRRRLLAAAARCFADRGFHGTTIREIAQRAKVNVAAGNYHFGSKKELYLEVLRGEFAQAKLALQAGGASPTPAELDRLDREGLIGVLHARMAVMLRLMIGPPPGLYGTLMQREMVDPSEALPIIVDEFIRPWMTEMTGIIARLEPTLDDDAVERCAMSVVGQALFFRASMPVILRFWKLRAYTPALRDSLAEHIADFSVGGMAHRARGRRRTSRAR